MSYIIARASDVLDSAAFVKLNGCPKISHEIMREQAKQNAPTSLLGNDREMSVNELRTKLAKEGLDINASKEDLVARLEEYNASQI